MFSSVRTSSPSTSQLRCDFANASGHMLQESLEVLLVDHPLEVTIPIPTTASDHPEFFRRLRRGLKVSSRPCWFFMSIGLYIRIVSLLLTSKHWRRHINMAANSKLVQNLTSASNDITDWLCHSTNFRSANFTFRSVIVQRIHLRPRNHFYHNTAIRSRFGFEAQLQFVDVYMLPVPKTRYVCEWCVLASLVAQYKQLTYL
jgi:hypothetical protein